MLETWEEKGSQGSMGVTFAETHSSEDMETEEATSCNQAGSPLELIGTSTHPQNILPQFNLSTWNAGMEMEKTPRE